MSAEGADGLPVRMQRVIEQLWPEYIRPVQEGRIEASKQQQLYFAFKDKAIAAKELFESGLQNHASLSAALSARYAGMQGILSILRSASKEMRSSPLHGPVSNSHGNTATAAGAGTTVPLSHCTAPRMHASAK